MVKPTTSNANGGAQHEDRGDSSKYRGVRKRKWGKWVSEIRLPNSRERIWLGSYDTPEKAARAFDAALFCLRGRNAQFNFPESPPDIAGPESLTPSEIQAVAARFANEEVPSSGTRLMEHCTPSSSVSADGAAQVQDYDTTTTLMDWSFLNMLDSSSESMSDFSLISGLDDNAPNAFFPPPEGQEEQQHNMVDDNLDENGGDYYQSFHQHSYLWNF